MKTDDFETNISDDEIDIEEYLRLRNLLTSTSTTILTPNLGKWWHRHLFYSYLRFLFIAKVIDYLAYKKIFSKIEELPGDIITMSVCKTSWLLDTIIPASHIDILLFEMSEGLKLLNRRDLGTEMVANPMYLIDKTQPKEKEIHKGFMYSLSEEGLETYANQTYHILASNLYSSRLGRFISYIALGVAFVTMIITFFTII